MFQCSFNFESSLKFFFSAEFSVEFSFGCLTWYNRSSRQKEEAAFWCRIIWDSFSLFHSGQIKCRTRSAWFFFLEMNFYNSWSAYIPHLFEQEKKTYLGELKVFLYFRNVRQFGMLSSSLWKCRITLNYEMPNLPDIFQLLFTGFASMTQHLNPRF